MEALKPEEHPIVVGRRGAVKPGMLPGTGLGLGCWCARQFFLRPSYFAHTEGLMPALPWHWLILKTNEIIHLKNLHNSYLLLNWQKAFIVGQSPGGQKSGVLHPDRGWDFHLRSCIQVEVAGTLSDVESAGGVFSLSQNYVSGFKKK